MKTQRQRQEEQRKRKLAEVQRQVKDGSLVIRPMTAADRERNPPRPRAPRHR